MYTLGDSTPRIIHKEESYSINHSFPGSAAMERGAIVKFNGTTGQVEPITAATDVPFGFLASGCKGEGEKCTVTTYFVAIVKHLANAAVARGARVACVNAHTIGGVARNRFATAAATQYATGIALEAGAAQNDEILIGILRVPQLMPA